MKKHLCWHWHSELTGLPVNDHKLLDLLNGIPNAQRGITMFLMLKSSENK